MRSGVLAGVAAAAVIAVSAGCGGSNGGASESTTTSATANWASGVCAAISSYRGEITNAGAALKSERLSKSAIRTTAENVKSATATFVTTLNGLGNPGTEAGATVKETLDSLSVALTKEADALRAAGSGSALSAVSVVSTTLLDAKSQVASAVEKLKTVDAKGELADAFSQAPACAAVTGS